MPVLLQYLEEYLIPEGESEKPTGSMWMASATKLPGYKMADRGNRSDGEFS